jgi:hypothetical protein
MSTIYLDPFAMDATAGAIGEHAKEVGAAIGDLETTCSADVPPSLAGWLAEELRDITVHARLAELLYVVAALDTALRAQQIQTDQSLATAWPPLGTTDAGVSSTYDLGAVLAGATVVGGTGPAFVNDFVGPGVTTVGGFFLGASSGTGVSMSGLSTDAFLANNPLLGAASNLQATNPAAAAQLMGLHSSLFTSNAEMGSTWINSRPGASYIGDGLYRGNDGNIGSITDVYRNPDRPGEYLVD